MNPWRPWCTVNFMLTILGFGLKRNKNYVIMNYLMVYVFKLED